ncbi:MAG TPA: Ig-like domain-containing protein [Gaiellaceae bacterium]|nr:Ig-like domain-containing protein [Gaiellaceae bacterium]
MARRPLFAAFLVLAALVPLVFALGSANAQSTELFFSEYVEGSSNNKALEIYNGTGAPVDLAANGYAVQMCFNGSTSCTLNIPLTGTVAPGDVFVLAHSSAVAAVLAQADQTNGAGWFNGDDVVVLRHGATIVDSLGRLGEDPGTEWGSGLTSTADNTLRRKASIVGGDGDVLDGFDPALEWNGFATDTFAGLGFHFTGDEAPSVQATSPASGASGVALDANVAITFSEDVAVGGSWFSISCGTSGAHTATVSGGPRTFTLDPDADFVASESCTVTVLAGQVSDLDPDDPPDTMVADHVFSFATAAPPVEIHEIQGASHLSPLVGSTVSGVAGIVTATIGNGFYVQDPTPDADEATSEGIFVFTSSTPTVAVGDDVLVSGRVAEFRPGGTGSANLTTTEITSPTTTVLSSGNALPPPTVLGDGGRVPPDTVIEDDASGSVETSGAFDPAEDGIDFYESVEGMRVQVNDAVAVGPRNAFGEIPVVGDGGANAGVLTVRGGVVIRPEDFNPERILLDDTILATPVVDVGDGFTTPALGVMDYSFGNFKLNVTAPLTRVDGGLEREVTRAPTDHEVVVGTYNVENLDPGDGAAFARHADLIVNHLRAPDVLAIEEIQDNDGPTNTAVTDASVTWTTLIAAIEAAGGPTYEFRQIDPVDDEDGGQPGGNIRVGFLFRTDRGLEFIDRPGGDSTTPTTVVDHPSGPRLSFSPGRVDPQDPAWEETRKPLAGEFRLRGRKVFVVANHFSSKGGDDPLFGRFQPPTRSSEVARHAQAESVNAFVDAILAADPAANVVVLGDINDFEFSETVEILEGGVLTTLMETLPKPERYSYVFEGNSQVLDQILVSGNLLGNFGVEYDPVHVNAEFADQASDHDPQVARLDVRGRPTTK